jgi:hypothetical protein
MGKMMKNNDKKWPEDYENIFLTILSLFPHILELIGGGKAFCLMDVRRIEGI